jgi:histidinol phosphatase-like enzyme (inositol monophosphatase family)
MTATRPGDDVAARLEAALDAVRLASVETLRWYGDAALEVTRKADASPVTQADIAAEGILRRELLGRFPDDGFLGEETGATPGTNGYVWVVDPIDGTKSFIRGVPLWATLVGCRSGGLDGPGVVGVIAIPPLDEIVWASVGGGTWHRRGDASPTVARVSRRDSLGESLVCSSAFTSFADRPASMGGEVGGRAARDRLEESCLLCRTWGDGYGYLLVATGRADLMVDPLMNAWDAAAVETVIRESGGRFTDWQGRERIDSGEGIASNGLVHEAALAILERAHRGPG